MDPEPRPMLHFAFGPQPAEAGGRGVGPLAGLGLRVPKLAIAG
jgi:hypothetical protein